ncbi:MAG: protoporphyrinogen oxidase [Nitrospirales bacterium]|nr:MAG: protoporphyrinogen oxidase [Nitrospirales bacterium]
MGNPARRIVIVGGGISGLAATLAIQEESQRLNETFECTILEGQDRLGGKVLTHRVDDFVIEGGPDSFLTSKPWALELCEKLGLADQLINTNKANSQTFCFTKGRMRELPQGLVSFVPTRLGALFSGGLISPLGMLRMGWEWFVPRYTNLEHDESLASFFRRRLGIEAFDHFIEPLVAGIYAGDANVLSVKSTFPRFYDLEQQYGSLMKGIRAQRRDTPPPSAQPQPQRTIFTTLRGGLGDLIQALVKQLSSQGATLRTGHQVHELTTDTTSTRSTYTVVLDNHERLLADEVILATPAYVSAKLLEPLQPSVASLLSQIPYCSTATISLAFRHRDVETSIRGFGFVVPRIEGRAMLAATWTSLKWPNRANAQHSLIRCYIGGQGREQILQESDASLVAYVREQLQEMADISCDPLFSEVYRWDRAMPQYVCGHGQRLQDIRSLMCTLEGMHLTGAAFEGLGLPDCIREGTRVGSALVRAYHERRQNE